MEYDVVDRYKRDMDCKKYSDMTIQLKRERIEAEKKSLAAAGLAEQARLHAEMEAARLAEEAEAAEKRARNVQFAVEMQRERAETLRERTRRDKETRDAFDSLKDQWRSGHEAKLACIKRKDMENVEFNRLLQLEALKKQCLDDEAETQCKLLAADIQSKADEKRCIHIRNVRRQAEEAFQGRQKQIAARKADVRGKQIAKDEKEWGVMFHTHMCRMDELQAEADAAKRKKHQQDLLAQIAEKQAIKEKLLAAELGKKYNVTLPDRVDETEPRPEDRHAFSRRLRAARNTPPEPLCQCFDKK